MFPCGYSVVVTSNAAGLVLLLRGPNCCLGFQFGLHDVAMVAMRAAAEAHHAARVSLDESQGNDTKDCQ